MKLPTFIKCNSPFSSSGLLGVFFLFLFKFIANSRKPDQTLQSVASGLGMYYSYMSHEKTNMGIYFCCICYSHQLYCFFIELDNDLI